VIFLHVDVEREGLLASLNTVLQGSEGEQKTRKDGKSSFSKEDKGLDVISHLPQNKPGKQLGGFLQDG